MTGLTFFAIGSLRSRWSPLPWWRAGLNTTAIGLGAAAVAYVVGDLLAQAVTAAAACRVDGAAGRTILPPRRRSTPLPPEQAP